MKTKMKTIELKHLAPYLPYELKVKLGKSVYDIYALTLTLAALIKGFDSTTTQIEFKNIKPILRPLSDLTKEIEHNGKKFVPLKKIDTWVPKIFKTFKKSGIENAISGMQSLTCQPYEVIEKLFEWHFDVFGLIPKGLAIDINKLKQNKKI